MGIRGLNFLLCLVIASCGTTPKPNYDSAKYFSGVGRYENPSSGLSQPAPVGSKGVRLSWPVPQKNSKLTQKFHGGLRPHQGIDLANRKGTHIYAAHEGTIVYAGHDFSGFGNLVIVEKNSSWGSLYGHLNTIRVQQGQYIRRGTVIGTMGESGNAKGVHLHFELRRKTRPVDPLDYLP